MIREAIKSIKTPGKAPPKNEIPLVAQLDARAAEAAANLEQSRAAYAEAALAAAEGQAADLAGARKAVEVAQDTLKDVEAALQAAKARQAKADAERAAKARAEQLKQIKAAAKARIEAVEVLHEMAERYAAAHGEYVVASAALADALAPVGLHDQFIDRLSTQYCETRPRMDLRACGMKSAYKLPLESMHYVPFIEKLTADTDEMLSAAVKKLEQAS